MKRTITLINIVLPFWLEWARRFIYLKFKTKTLPKKIRGRSYNAFVIDEWSDSAAGLINK